MAEGTACVRLILIGIVVVLGIAIILICTSFADLEYFQMGFSKSKISGTVDTEKVYQSGRQWIGPTNTFKIFSASGHVLNLEQISVFAIADRVQAGKSGSVPITLGVDLVYFLVPDSLKLLHEKYDVNYETLMKNTAQAALKDAANEFKLTDFLEEREKVEAALHAGVQRRLGGTCCQEDCTKTLCVPGCIPRTSCTDDDRGFYVDVRYLQLVSLAISKDVERINLNALLLTEETAKETYVQQAALIRKETEKMVNVISNNADEIQANATAQSTLIDAKSKALYQQILEGARKEGLKVLFNTIGLTASGHKNSFDYLRSLAENNKVFLTVDYDQLIRGNF